MHAADGHDITRDGAERLVAWTLDDDWVVDADATVEHAVGWAVSTVPKRYAQTRDFADLPLGAGPTIVTRDGRLFGCGSMQPLGVCFEDVAVLIGQAGLVARLRHRWRVFSGTMVVFEMESSR